MKATSIKIKGMKSITRLIAQILFVIFSCQTIKAQVIVQLYQPPPNQWRLEHLWNLTLTNTSEKPYSVYLSVNAEEVSEGKVFEGTSAAFELAGRFSGRVNPRSLEPADISYTNSNIEEFIYRTGSLKEGVYTICVAVIDANSGLELGKNCIVQIITHISPPELIAPFDGTSVYDMNPVFIWTAPMPLDPRTMVSYRLRIVEMLGEQVPLEAIENNRAFFTQSNIPATSFQYPIAARSFKSEMNYAWQVTAYNSRGNYELGKSPVWSFQKTDEFITDSLPLQQTACKPFEVKLENSKINDTLFAKLYISFNDSIEPINMKPAIFSVEIQNNMFGGLKAKEDRQWKRKPEKINNPTDNITWRYSRGSIPSGKYYLGDIVYHEKDLKNTRIIYKWLDISEGLLCCDTILPAWVATEKYIQLTETFSENYIVMADTLLNLQYHNLNPSTQLAEFMIIDYEKQQPVRSHSEKQDLPYSFHGLNRFRINLKDYSLTPGKIYLLAVSDIMAHYYLKFKIHATNEK